MSYRPQPQQAAILARALEHVNSVPYRVTARWVFYRLLQDGFYSGKGDYHGRFLPLTAKARKGFFGDWHPATFADDTRAPILMQRRGLYELYIRGQGFKTKQEWLQKVAEEMNFPLDKWQNQDYYIEIWFEAAAMVGQFLHYTEHIPLLAFRGDVSIPEKWATAKRLEEAADRYDIPVVVLYFGDDDPKGHEIPENALADIRAWCSVDLEYVRCGLNVGDGDRLGIPENPDEPGHYQWEALSDDQAGGLITSFIDTYYNQDALKETQAEQERITDEFRDRFQTFIDDWDSED